MLRLEKQNVGFPTKVRFDGMAAGSDNQVAQSVPTGTSRGRTVFFMFTPISDTSLLTVLETLVAG